MNKLNWRWPTSAIKWIAVKHDGLPSITSQLHLPYPRLASNPGGKSAITHLPPVEDDPQKRKPDISVARQHMGWEPKVIIMHDIMIIISSVISFVEHHVLLLSVDLLLLLL